MKMILKGLISVVILIVMITAVKYVIDFENNNKYNHEQVTDFKLTSETFLEEYEFSGIRVSNGYIYAGGNSGVFRIDSNNFEIVEIKNGEDRFSFVRSLAFDDLDNLWIGHEEGIAVFDGKEVIKTYTLEDGLVGNRVNDVYIGEDRIYVGTFKGISIIENDLIYDLTEEHGLQKNITKVVYEDKSNRLWAGSYMSTGGGVTVFNPSSFDQVEQMQEATFLTTENGLSHHAITSFLETDEGIWVGNGSYTEGGATLFNKTNFEAKKIMTLENGLIGGKVRYIFEDKDNNIWFCSESDGICILHKDNKFTYLTTEDGLSDNEVKEMTYDNMGNLWLASRRGVTLINAGWLKENLENID